MEKLIVRPCPPLRGRVVTSGAKNAALPILAACLLCEGEGLLENLPDIRDVRRMQSILSDMGGRIEEVGEGACLFSMKGAA